MTRATQLSHRRVRKSKSKRAKKPASRKATVHDAAHPSELPDSVIKTISIEAYDRFVAGLTEPQSAKEQSIIKAHRRRISNRISAANSRARAKYGQENLAADLRRLEHRNQQLVSIVTSLEQENCQLRCKLFEVQERSFLAHHAPFPVIDELAATPSLLCATDAPPLFVE